MLVYRGHTFTSKTDTCIEELIQVLKICAIVEYTGIDKTCVQILQAFEQQEVRENIWTGSVNAIGDSVDS